MTTQRLLGLVAVWCDTIMMLQSHANRVTALIEKHAVHQSPRRVDELVKIFIHATRVSI
jgi:thiaminase